MSVDHFTPVIWKVAPKPKIFSRLDDFNVLQYSRCCRYDLRMLDWNIVYCTHGTLQGAAIMCRSQDSRHVSLASHLLWLYRNAWTCLAQTHTKLASPHSWRLWTQIRIHIYKNAPRGLSMRPHRLHTKIPFISSNWLLLCPVAWFDQRRQGLTSSVFIPCSFTLTLSTPSLSTPTSPPLPNKTLIMFAFH